MGSKLRIMHGLSEVAGQNCYSVSGLKELGEKAETVVYCEHPFGYPYDKSLNINKSKRILLPLYAGKLVVFFLKSLKKYDCFHFHFGHSILEGVELGIYKKRKKRLFFEFHGSDLRDQKMFCKKSGMTYNPKEATSPKIHKRNKKICKIADGIIIHDDELLPYLPKECAPVYEVPLRLDVNQFEPVYPEQENNNIRIVHAPSAREIKGTKYVLKALESLKKKYDNIEFILVEGKTQKEAFEIYKTADIIVDQLFIGTYGVFAIECMAMGKPVITYISDEMKERLPEELPIISAHYDNIEEILEKMILDGNERRKKGMESRKYVEDYHDYRSVARVLRAIYYGKTIPKTGRKAFEQVKAYREKYGDVR